MEHNTIIVNLYAGPGAGKSTSAAYIFAKLKMQGISAEYVPEYAKEVTWEGSVGKLHNQVYITGKQSHRIERLLGKVDVIVTDSPVLLGYLYTDSVAMKNVCIELNEKYNAKAINVMLRRSKAYQAEGRNQTEKEAIELDAEIRRVLTDIAKVDFTELGTSPMELDTLVGDIIGCVRGNAINHKKIGLQYITYAGCEYLVKYAGKDADGEPMARVLPPPISSTVLDEIIKIAEKACE